MFGQFVYQRDSDLVAAKDRKDEQLDYARELLADLLNRAAVLEEGPYWLMFERHLHATDAPGEYELALKNLAGALRVFLDDVGEARVRARRARLVATDSLADGMVGTDFEESGEGLAEVGGPLIQDPEA